MQSFLLPGEVRWEQSQLNKKKKGSSVPNAQSFAQRVPTSENVAKAQCKTIEIKVRIRKVGRKDL